MSLNNLSNGSAILAVYFERSFESEGFRDIVQQEVVKVLTKNFIEENSMRILGNINLKAITNMVGVAIAEEIAKKAVKDKKVLK
jgi:hypothetical protein